MGTFVPGKVGQVVIPVSAAALQGLDAQAIADTLAPLIIRVARELGGAPIGAPELLKADELLARTDDPTIRDTVADAGLGSLFIVAEMIPAAQADEIARTRNRHRPGRHLEVVSRPVVPHRRRHRR